MLKQYFSELKNLLNVVEKTELESLTFAAERMAHCVENNGIIHVFGCGHSHMIGEELCYRAGGLAPISPILVEDLMLHKGAVRSSRLEKKNDSVAHFMSDVQILTNDILITVSTSGRNPVPIDVAQIAKNKGAFVIAITSKVYAESESSRHKEGLYLSDVADLTIDNHILVGDAVLQHPQVDVPFGSASTIINMSIANGIIAHAVDILAKNNIQPPLFKSGNINGSEEHNQRLVDRYKQRIRLFEN